MVTVENEVMNEVMNEGGAEGLAVVGAFFVVYAVIIGIALLVGVATTIIQMIYAKNNGAKYWGLLLLPFGAQYVLGQLADQYEDKNARVKFPVLYIPFWVVYFVFMAIYGVFFFNMMNGASEESAITFALIMMGVGFFMGAYAIFLSVYQYIVYYRIIAYKNRENAALWLVLTILFGGIPYIVFQLMYMNKPGKAKDEMTLVPVIATVPEETPAIEE